MIRTFVLLALAVLVAGCSRYHSRAQGPFAQKKDPPPPYGAVGPLNTSPKPIGNQSPLGIASADLTPVPPPNDPLLIPPKPNGPVPAGGIDPLPTDANADALPPFRRRPEPQPGSLPSPYAPKTPDAPKTPGTDTPVTPKDAPNALAQVKPLLAAAGAAWKATDNYEATLTRRELNPKGDLNSEVLLYQFRREPMSVFTRTIGGNGKGRETVYNPGKFGDKMHVMLGEGDSKLAKAGFIAPPISPDDPRVKEKSRYSIRDAGFGLRINELNAVVAKIEAGKAPADALVYHGEVRREEYAHSLVGITLKLRPGDDPLMPTGGTRSYFFDMKKDSPSYGMAVLVFALDPKGKEAEYYLFEKVKSPAGLTDADFNPARLGKK